MALVQYQPSRSAEALLLEALANALPWSDAVANALREATKHAGGSHSRASPVDVKDGAGLARRREQRKDASSRADMGFRDGVEPSGGSGSGPHGGGRIHRPDAGTEGPEAAAARQAVQLALATMGTVPGYIKGVAEERCSAATLTLSLAMATAAKGDLPPALLQLVSPYRAHLEQIRELGRGGFGSVVAVRSRLDQRLMAVKSVSFRSDLPPWAPPEQLEQRHAKMLREVQALAGLDGSPHIVRYYNAWIEPAWDKLGQQLRRSSGAGQTVAAEVAKASLQSVLRTLALGQGRAPAAAAAMAHGQTAASARAPKHSGNRGGAASSGLGRRDAAGKRSSAERRRSHVVGGGRTCSLLDASGSLDSDTSERLDIDAARRGSLGQLEAGVTSAGAVACGSAGAQRAGMRRPVPRLEMISELPAEAAASATGTERTGYTSADGVSADLHRCLDDHRRDLPLQRQRRGFGPPGEDAKLDEEAGEGEKGEGEVELGKSLAPPASPGQPIVTLPPSSSETTMQQQEERQPRQRQGRAETSSDGSGSSRSSSGGDSRSARGSRRGPAGGRMPAGSGPAYRAKAPATLQPSAVVLASSPEDPSPPPHCLFGDRHSSASQAGPRHRKTASTPLPLHLPLPLAIPFAPQHWQLRQRPTSRATAVIISSLSTSPEHPQAAGGSATPTPTHGSVLSSSVESICVPPGYSCTAVISQDHRHYHGHHHYDPRSSEWPAPSVARRPGDRPRSRRGHGDDTGGASWSASGGRDSEDSRVEGAATIDSASEEDSGGSRAGLGGGRRGRDLMKEPRDERLWRGERSPPSLSSPQESDSWTFDRGPDRTERGRPGCPSGSQNSNSSSGSGGGSSSGDGGSRGSSSSRQSISTSATATATSGTETAVATAAGRYHSGASRDFSWTFDRGEAGAASGSGRPGTGPVLRRGQRGDGGRVHVEARGDGGKSGRDRCTSKRRRQRHSRSGASGVIFRMDGETASVSTNLLSASGSEEGSGDSEDSGTGSESSSDSTSDGSSSGEETESGDSATRGRSGSESSSYSGHGSGSSGSTGQTSDSGSESSTELADPAWRNARSLIIPPFQVPLPAPAHRRTRQRRRRPSSSSHSNKSVAPERDLAVLSGITRWPYRLYICMELVVGPTLTRWLQMRAERLAGLAHPPETSLERSIFRQIVMGLAHIHGAGVIHRDLKPANIFLVPLVVGASGRRGFTGGGAALDTAGLGGGSAASTESYLVKIGDFGLAAPHTDPAIILSAAASLASTSSSSEGSIGVAAAAAAAAALAPSLTRLQSGLQRRPSLPLLTAPATAYTSSSGASPSSSGEAGRGTGPAGSLNRRPATAGPGRNASGGLSLTRAASSTATPRTSGVGTASYSAPEQLRQQRSGGGAAGGGGARGSGEDGAGAGGGVDDSGDSGISYYGPEVDIYPLGLILMELFCVFGTAMERANAMRAAREGRLPASFLRAHPDEARLAEACLNSRPELRPTAAQLLALLDLLWGPARGSAATTVTATASQGLAADAGGAGGAARGFSAGRTVSGAGDGAGATGTGAFLGAGVGRRGPGGGVVGNGRSHAGSLDLGSRTGLQERGWLHPAKVTELRSAESSADGVGVTPLAKRAQSGPIAWARPTWLLPPPVQARTSSAVADPEPDRQPSGSGAGGLEETPGDACRGTGTGIFPDAARQGHWDAHAEAAPSRTASVLAAVTGIAGGASPRALAKGAPDWKRDGKYRCQAPLILEDAGTQTELTWAAEDLAGPVRLPAPRHRLAGEAAWATRGSAEGCPLSPPSRATVTASLVADADANASAAAANKAAGEAADQLAACVPISPAGRVVAAAEEPIAATSHAVSAAAEPGPGAAGMAAGAITARPVLLEATTTAIPVVVAAVETAVPGSPPEPCAGRSMADRWGSPGSSTTTSEAELLARLRAAEDEVQRLRALLIGVRGRDSPEP